MFLPSGLLNVSWLQINQLDFFVKKILKSLSLIPYFRITLNYRIKKKKKSHNYKETKLKQNNSVLTNVKSIPSGG